MGWELEKVFLQTVRLAAENLPGQTAEQLAATARLLLLRRRLLEVLADVFGARGGRLISRARRAGCPLLNFNASGYQDDRLDELLLQTPGVPAIELDVLYQQLLEIELRKTSGAEATWRIDCSRMGRRARGVFFTPLWLARRLADWVAGANSPRVILDPACGSGRLLLGVARLLQRKTNAPAKMRRLVAETLRGIEIEPLLVALARTNLWLAADPSRGALPELEQAVVQADALIEPWPQAQAIVANPPFEILTGFARHPQAAAYRKRLRELGRGGTVKGVAALHWLFLERALAELEPEGRLAIILPASFLTDRAVQKLRRLVLEKGWLRRVEHFEERRRVFAGVNQGVVWLGMEKRTSRSLVMIRACGLRLGLESETARKLDPRRWPIPLVTAGLLKIADRLARNNQLTFGDIAMGAVGEVDQTLYRDYICDLYTGTLLVRGEHLGPYRANLDQRPGPGRWLERQGFEKARGGGRWREDVLRERVAQTGIVNLGARRRLVAAPVPAGVFLGNSVNYWLPGGLELEPVAALGYLLALLNSLVYEWRFRLTSSNNNINLYEVRALPAVALEGDGADFTLETMLKRFWRLATGPSTLSPQAIDDVWRGRGGPPARQKRQVAGVIGALAWRRAEAQGQVRRRLDRLLDYLVGWHLGVSQAEMASMEQWLAKRYGWRKE